MSKPLIVFISIMICIIAVLFVFLRDIQAEKSKVQKINMEYEKYLNTEVYGTDVGTLINKAVNSNERNNVKKDGQRKIH